MKIVLQLPRDINRFCRTCMKVTKSKNLYKDYIVKNGKVTKLGKILENVISTKINPKDQLPTTICSDCVDQLNEIHSFEDQCKTTEQKIRSLLSSTNSSQVKDNLNKTNEQESNADCNEEQEFILPSDPTSSQLLFADLQSEFICAICEESFTNHHFLSKHIIEHDNENSLLDPLLATHTINPEDSKAPTETYDDPMNVLQVQPQKVIPSSIESPRIPTTAKSLECSLCNKLFSDASLLSLHFLSHALASGDTITTDVQSECLFCENCGQIFKSNDDLNEHYYNTHKAKPIWQCFNCFRVYERELHLIKHDMIHLDNDDSMSNDQKKTLTCALCPEYYSIREELLRHSVGHLMKSYTCNECEKAFFTRPCYLMHLKLHPGYRYSCKICGNSLKTKSSLNRHMMEVHSEEPKYECKECSKRFATPARLKTHSVIHSSNKNYICSICGYRTHKVGDLKIHSRSHTSERPYKCTFTKCNMRFKTSSHLCDHIRRHLKVKRFKCTTCSQNFSTSHGLKTHLMQHTGEKPFSCIMCNMKFRRKHHLKIHMKQHDKLTN